MMMAIKVINGVKELISYIIELRAEIAVIAIVFVIFAVAGFFAGLNYQNTQGTTAPSSTDNTPNTVSLTTISSIIGIVISNVVGCLMASILGLALGFVPLLFAITNGLTIGMLVGSTLPKTNIFLLLAAVVPYGVFEIPAVLLSSAIGLRLGYSLIKRVMGKKGLLIEVQKGLKIFIFWVLPLIILAAIIQVVITLPLLSSISAGV
jgi:stage II sporulation protein M